MSLNFGYSEPKQKAANTPAVDTSNFLQKTGDAMTGNLDLGGNKINKLDHPVNSIDGANKMYVDDLVDFPNNVNTNYNTAANSRTMSAGGSTIQTEMGAALTAWNSVEPKKIVELQLSFNRNIRLGFFFDNKSFALFGELDYLDGFVESAEITIIQPSLSQPSFNLNNVQMMGCSQTTPTTMQQNLTDKFTPSSGRTGDLTAGTYNLVPTDTTFTGLRYIGFMFEGVCVFYTLDKSDWEVLNKSFLPRLSRERRNAIYDSLEGTKYSYFHIARGTKRLIKPNGDVVLFNN